MTRIAVGAFLQETDTFAPTKATCDDFVAWTRRSLAAERKVIRAAQECA